MANELETLIDELRKDPAINAKKEQQEKVTDANIGEFILDKASQLINTSLGSVIESKELISTGTNPEEMLAYSDLIKATATALETVNKIYLQNKKAQTAKELKEMELKRALPAGGNITNNTLIIAGREEIMKKFLSEVKAEFDKEPITIEATVEEIPAE